LAISYIATTLRIILLERLIILGRIIYGSDRGASIEPAGFRQLIRAVRKTEKAMGDGNIVMDEKEV